MRQGSDGWSPTARALLLALDEWADRGMAPPKSHYPSMADGTLVSLAEAARAFPTIPNVTFPTMLNELSLPDFGPQFGPRGGRLSRLPPALGANYQVMIPKTDSDGLDLGGIRAVEVAAPVATLTGWNVRAAGHRRPELCELNGSYIPFPKTKAEREQRGDPRPSLEERYGDRAGYVNAVAAAARQLVKNRFLLQEDADRYIEAAKASDVLR
jgi:alpha/beta hydrolase family protein